MKVLIGTKAGGHSTEALGIIFYLFDENEFKKFDISIFTEKEDKFDYEGFIKESKDKIEIYRTCSWRKPTKKFINPFKLLRNLIDSYIIIKRTNPEIIICNGANTSLLLGWLGKKWFNKKVIAVESLNRITIPSKAPKFLSKFCDEVWIPHKELEGKYNGKEKYIGFYHPFKDLIETMKELSFPKMEKRIVVGSVVKNDFEEGIKGLNPLSLLMKMKQTETLVTNAGLTAWEGAELCDKVIVYPLVPSTDNHQEEFAKWLSKRYKNVEVKYGI